MVEITRDFDGVERTFRVKDPALFEQITPRKSVYAYLQLFTAGDWSIDDVALVLSFALHGPTPHLAREWSLMKQMGRWGSALQYRLSYTPHPDVVAVVSKAPGNYAPIAIDLLTELVFGSGASVEADDE
ncbi:hypothetical protein DKP76_01510 [Falsochrobactrum shanghaiense]|uniref:Uncharacterized protein n=1 Tax=Falsochrobactrum shanghaiense TaxID=2201899 RepID=A0A316JFA5_9HYPH|nr:hypothetical protein [Falsochrobactrum shanghaiense]PWL19265.1 hypothetical protein DKP76_01510 [Falsochrobactrum shanghaiense]